MRILSLTPFLAVVVLGAFAVGCAGANAAAPPASSTPPATSAAQVAAPAAPDTPAGHQLAWVISSLDHPPTDADTASHFAPDFLSQVPAAQVSAIFVQLNSSAAPYALDRVDDDATPRKLTATVRSAKGSRLRISLAIEPGESGRMAGLLIKPAD